MTGWLLVRSAEHHVALPVGMVEEIIVVPPPLPAPGVVAAVRGVAPYRGRLVPLVHLAAAIGEGAPPPTVGTTAVVVLVGDHRILLEVDEATDLTTAPETPLPRGWRGRWAAGAVRRDQGLVPILDLDWLAGCLTPGAVSATA